MDNNQTLKEALVAEGHSDQANSLTSEAQNLTKSEIVDFINGDAKETLTVSAISSIKRLVVKRISNGEHAFPWKSMPDIKADSGDLGGGVW
jgi:hypothetical protein